MLGTFEKAKAVLDLYTTARPEWGVTETARQLGWPASSTHVLMSSLTQMGLLHRTVTGRYRLGFKLLALSQVLLLNTPWRDVAQEEMTTLLRRCGETLHLAAFDGGQLVSVTGFAGRHPDSVPSSAVGAGALTYPAASGTVLLAHRPWSVARQALMNEGLRTPDELDSALLVLEQVVLRGMAESQDDRLWSVSAPIRNHNGEVIAALGASVPVTRPAERRAALSLAVQEAGRLISHRIGFTKSPPGDRLFWTSVEGRDRLRRAPQRKSVDLDSDAKDEGPLRKA